MSSFNLCSRGQKSPSSTDQGSFDPKAGCIQFVVYILGPNRQHPKRPDSESFPKVQHELKCTGFRFGEIKASENVTRLMSGFRDVLVKMMPGKIDFL